MKLTNLELTEIIKANYSYNSSTDFYHVQDILTLTDKLLKRDDIDRGKLLDLLQEVEQGNKKND